MTPRNTILDAGVRSPLRRRAIRLILVTDFAFPPRAGNSTLHPCGLIRLNPSCAERPALRVYMRRESAKHVRC